ncbi:Ig-like domain-containing protein [Bifidobacterium catulorum]|uniref:Bacterial Ig-like domain-containing protein n=1 Tax=Bifidobacterium catulorum TaxID=1630173 RepID=A0A2U2MT94_9BIFI|nr:Ig-like domain-containing protein [Bifidobacterium catulorum]PWG60073.1 hypothetical protein DF200_04035 [Bifidobacterium catulorum]
MGLNSLSAARESSTRRPARLHDWKKRVIGVLAAAATVATMGLTAVTANAADGAWDQLSATEKKSSYGYFIWKSENATDANEKTTAKEAAELLKTAHFKDQTNIGAADDATALDNMQTAIEQIIAINTFRSSLKNEPCRTDLPKGNPARACDDNGAGLTPLKVTDKMMAASQSNVNYSSHQFGHAANNGQSWTFALENLYASSYYSPWTSDNRSVAADSWYSEINNYDDHPLDCGSSAQIGHYRALTNKICFTGETKIQVYPFSTTGLAIAKHARFNTGSGWQDYPNGMTESQVYGGMQYQDSAGYEYDASDYLNDFKTYVAMVNAATKTITSVDDPAAISVASGTTKPTAQLPAKVTAHYSDNTTADVDVTWEAIPNDWNKDRTAHTVKVNGTVDGWAKKVTATLNVAAATVTKATIDGTAAATDITTPSGTNPDGQLPKTGKVSWSNGDTSSETINWQSSAKDQYGKREGGTYDLTGAIAGKTVTAHVTVTAATVKSVAALDDITVVKGSKPTNIPSTAEVTWSNGDTTAEPITWTNDPTKATFDQLGEQTFNGTVKGQPVTLKITVVDAKVTNVTNPADITVESGTNPNAQLPTTVKATLSDGTTKDVAVTWTPAAVPEATWKDRQGGNATLTGKVAGYDGTVTLNVIVKPATITGATLDPATLSTPAGLDPTSKLPKTAKVTWSNGDTTDGTVAWDKIDAKSYATVGSFNATGTVTADGQTTKVTLPVTVTAAAALTAKATAASVDTVATHAPDLSTINATVTYSDGTTTTNTVAWDKIDAGKYAQAGTFTVNGTVQQTTVTRAAGDLTDANGKPLTVSVTVNVKARAITAVEPTADTITVDSGRTAPANLTGKAKVTWNDGATETRDIALTLPEGWNKPHTAHYVTATGKTDGWDKDVEFTVSVKAATAESAKNPADFSTVEGNVPTLPKTAEVTWSNGETTAENVIWDEPADFDKLFDKASDQPVTVTGEVAGKTVTVKITVVAASIESVTAPKDVEVNAGQTPNLPTSVEAKFSNGKTGTVAVTWKTDGVDFSNRSGKDKTIAVKGEVNGYKDGVTVNVIVHSAKAVSATVNGDKTITVDSGTPPELPKTATVKWNDGGKDSTETITWDAFDKWQSRDGGQFTVNGTVAGLPVSVKVIVNAATVVDVQATVKTSTKPGVKPELPKTAWVKWSNDDTTNEPIVWNEIPAKDYATAGTFEVKGTVTVKNAAHTVTATVDVKNVEVKYVEDGVDIPTTVGKAPQLPATVKVHWSDGSTTDETVTWNDVPASAYAKVGSFAVKGTAFVGGKAYTITANVTVKAAAATTPGNGGAQVTTNTGATAGQSSKLSRTGAAIGAIVAVVVVLLAAAGVVFYARSKRTH